MLYVIETVEYNTYIPDYKYEITETQRDKAMPVDEKIKNIQDFINIIDREMIWMNRTSPRYDQFRDKVRQLENQKNAIESAVKAYKRGKK